MSTSVRSVLLALIASAIAVNGTKSISLKVAGPESVDTVQDLRVTTVVTNTGNEILKLLNDPSSSLSTIPANTFRITSRLSDAAPIFTGVKVKYVPGIAAIQKAYTVLAPGESIRVDHDLSTMYNFTKCGEGSYSFEPRRPFYVVDNSDDSGTITTLNPKVVAHTAKVSGKLAVSRSLASVVEKRATYNGCTATEQTALVSAVSAAKTYASNASDYLAAHSSSTARYTMWFGPYTQPRHKMVQSHFSNIASNDFAGFRFDCTCTDSGTYAYVYPDQFGTIYLCGAFWKAPPTGADSKGGTLVHEASHFTTNGGTDDHAYGQASCKLLATTTPDQAADNADSHEYFAENNPALA